MRGKNELQRITKVYRGYATDSALEERLSLTNPGNRMIIRERWQAITAHLASNGWLPLVDRRVLDVGCGFGGELAQLFALGADPALCCGVDLMPERIQEARKRYPAADFRVGNAEMLNFDDNRFDLVVLSTVLSSVLDPTMRVTIAREVARVLKAGGAVLWYDIRYPSPANPHVRPVSRRNLRLLFPRFRLSLRSITLLPPVARRLRGAALLYPALAAVPLLRSHLVGLIVKPGAREVTQTQDPLRP